MVTNLDKYENKKKALTFICIMFAIEIVLGLFLYSVEETMMNDYLYIKYINEHSFLSVYNNKFISIPPIYLAWLKIIGKPAAYLLDAESSLFILLMKSFVILFSMGTVFYIWKKISPSVAVAVTAPVAFILNTTARSEKEVVFCLLLFLILYFIYNSNPKNACICFAIGCLVVENGIFLVFPIVGAFALWFKQKKYTLNKLAEIAGISGLIIYAGWLPFVIASKNALYPVVKYAKFLNNSFEICLGGLSTWIINEMGLVNIQKDSVFCNIMSIVTVLVCLGAYGFTVAKFKNEKGVVYGSLIFYHLMNLICFNQRSGKELYVVAILIFVYAFVSSRKEFKRSSVCMCTVSSILAMFMWYIDINVYILGQELNNKGLSFVLILTVVSAVAFILEVLAIRKDYLGIEDKPKEKIEIDKLHVVGPAILVIFAILCIFVATLAVSRNDKKLSSVEQAFRDNYIESLNNAVEINIIRETNEESYASCLALLQDVENQKGKVVRMAGIAKTMESNGVVHHLCVIPGANDSVTGMEYYLEDTLRDYPEDDEIVVIQGVLDTYDVPGDSSKYVALLGSVVIK